MKHTNNRATHRIKVCGLKYADNITDISTQVQPDYMGFIFYEKSKRFVGEDFDETITQNISPKIQKVGVFVNSDYTYICSKIERYKLDLIQLHGDETPLLCSQLKNIGTKVIKVFSVAKNFNFTQLTSYETVVDYFLFDTKGKEYGGNGIRFNWQLLEHYKSDVPLFLSGGIGLASIEEIKVLQSKKINIYALDVNSQFETEPAIKQVEQLLDFKNQLVKT